MTALFEATTSTGQSAHGQMDVRSNGAGVFCANPQMFIDLGYLDFLSRLYNRDRQICLHFRDKEAERLREHIRAEAARKKKERKWRPSKGRTEC